MVGGISRTVERDGWRFDIGGHRFFTKVPEVEAFWHEILPDDDFLMRPRMSRIYYNGKFFDYPLKAGNALEQPRHHRGASAASLSYLWARVRPPKDQSNFEGWVAARFGWRLYRIFFKTYTEKVWGVPATEIQADWAAQRIKNLSLFKAVMNALLPKRNQKDITSLIEEFQYPKYGPGMMWERCREKVEAQGSKVVMETRVDRDPPPRRQGHARSSSSPRAARPSTRCSHVISSMPISAAGPGHGPAGAGRGARPRPRASRYRDFLTVALVVPGERRLPRQLDLRPLPRGAPRPDPELRLLVAVPGQGRPHLPRPRVLRLRGRRPLGLRRRRPRRARQAGAREDRPGRRPSDVEAGYVVRMPKAYPVYDETYKANVDIMRAWLDEQRPQRVSRSAATACTATTTRTTRCTRPCSRSRTSSAPHHDIWNVNVEEEYHEEKEKKNDEKKADEVAR